MTANYYYLISGLPELNINEKEPEYSVLSFREEVRDLVSPSDFLLISALYYRFDIINIINLIKDGVREFDPRGSLNKEELRSGLINPEMLPTFIESFILESRNDWNASSDKVLQNKLTEFYIEWSRQVDNAYLREWLEFDNNLRNLLTGLNCKRFDLSTTKEVLGDYYEAEAIRKSKEKDFGLRTVIPLVDEIVSHFDNPDIAVREFALEELRWKFADELDQNYYFSVENLMTYAIKLQLNQRNVEANPMTGEEKLDALLSNIKQGYELPSEFE